MATMEVNQYQLNLNPLDIEDILRIVLQYIETNTKDLLSCRLVNHLWNSVVVQILKRKHRNLVVRVDHNNTSMYQSCLIKSQLPKTARLNLKLVLDAFSSSKSKPQQNGHQEHDHFSSILQILNPTQDELEEPCNVTSVIYNTCDYAAIYDVMTIWNIIQSTAPNLTRLDLTKHFDGLSTFIPHTNDGNWNVKALPPLTSPVSFPQLTSITYDLENGVLKVAQNDDILIALINSSPQLKSLSLIDGQSSLAFHDCAFEGHTGVILKAIQPSITSNIQVLEIPLYFGTSTFEALNTIQFSQLTTIKLHERHAWHTRPEFWTFLETNSTIKYFDLYFEQIWRPVQLESSLEHLINNLSKIDNIIEYGLYNHIPFRNIQAKSYAKSRFVDNFIFGTALFPNVKEIKLDLDGCLAIAENPEEIRELIHWNPNIIYRSVTIATIQIPLMINEIHNKKVLGGLSLAFAFMLPNIENLRLTINSTEYDGNNANKTLQTCTSTGVLEALLRQQESIKNLKVRNLSQRMMVEFLNQENSNNIISQSVEKLRLRLSSGHELNQFDASSVYYSDSDYGQKIENLKEVIDKILIMFPHLQLLELDHRLVRTRRGPGSSFETLMAELNNCRKIFPNLALRMY